MIQVTTTGFDDVFNRLRLIPDGQDKALARTADEVFDFVEHRVDAHTQTGAMRDSLFIRKRGDTYLIGHDLGRAPYSVFVHWGARPHVIEPRTKKALRWVAGGAFAFAKRVNHPGYRGDPYLVDAANAMPAMFQRHAENVIRGI